jgi:hypothetical protein
MSGLQGGRLILSLAGVTLLFGAGLLSVSSAACEGCGFGEKGRNIHIVLAMPTPGATATVCATNTGDDTHPCETKACDETCDFRQEAGDYPTGCGPPESSIVVSAPGCTDATASAPGIEQTFELNKGFELTVPITLTCDVP